MSTRRCIAALPLPIRVGQLVWPSVYSAQLDEGARYAQWKVGGVILMDWTTAASAEGLAEFVAESTIRPLIAVDEEGGTVQRMRSLGVLPSARSVATTMSPTEALTLVEQHAAMVRSMGIDMVLGPVVDVAEPGGGGPLGTRTFSDDPEVVSAYARAYVDAWIEQGVIPVLKHFPGHGGATADSHVGRARTAPLQQVLARDVTPYRALAGAGAAVMVGHLDVPGLTDSEGVPASLSHAAITDLLRNQLGYGDSLVMTDALGMGAITSWQSVASAAVRAVAAGADVVIFSNIDQTQTVLDALQDAVESGDLPTRRVDDAVERILEAKDVDPCALPA